MNSVKRGVWLLGLGTLALLLLLVVSLRLNIGVRQPNSELPSVSQPVSQPAQKASLYAQPMLFGEGAEWRAYPLLVDINGDGHRDLVATHRLPAQNNALHIWLGTGQGTFDALPQTWPSPGYSGLAAGDINRDGHVDLLAGSHFHQMVTFMGDGTGQFTASVLEKHDGCDVIRLVDVNGDGYLDAISLGSEDAGLEIYLGDGTGQWTLTAQLRSGNIGRDLAVADLNGDGKPDIVVLFEYGVVIFLQDSTGGWSESTLEAYAISGKFRSLALGDVNGDGHLDMALNGQFLGPNTVHGPDVYLSDGQGGWRAASQGLKTIQSASQGVALGDMDQDGCLDLVAGANNTSAIDEKAYGLVLYTGDCQGNWTMQPDSGLPIDGLVVSHGIALVDINHDGRLDIAVTHGTSNSVGYVTVWLHR